MLCTLTVSQPTKHLDNRQKYREYRVRFRTHGRKFVMARCNFLLLFFCAFKCIFKCVLCVRWYGERCAKGFRGKKGCLWVCQRRRDDDNETLECTDGNSMLAILCTESKVFRLWPTCQYSKRNFFFSGCF